MRGGDNRVSDQCLFLARITRLDMHLYTLSLNSSDSRYSKNPGIGKVISHSDAPMLSGVAFRGIKESNPFKELSDITFFKLPLKREYTRRSGAC